MMAGPISSMRVVITGSALARPPAARFSPTVPRSHGMVGSGSVRGFPRRWLVYVGRRIVVAGVVAALAGTFLSVVAAAGSGGGPSDVGAVRTATLPTGDRVTVIGGARPAVSIRPAAGREKVMFHRYRTREHFYVVPEDLTRRVGTGWDRQGFDLAGLLTPNRQAAAPAAEPGVTGDSVELTINLRDLVVR